MPKTPNPPTLLTLAASTDVALNAAAADLAESLRAAPERPLGEFAAELAERPEAPHRRAVVARDAAEAHRLLTVGGPGVLGGVAPSAERRPTAFLFSGLGDHYVNLARGLYEDVPRFRRELDRIAELLLPDLEEDVRTVLFAGPRPVASGGKLDLKALLGRGKPEPEDPEIVAAGARLARTDLAQPTLFAVELALAELWRSWGVLPDAVLGYSLGEYVAATVAGILDPAAAAALVARRARAIAALPEGAMLAVPMDAESLRRRLPPELDLAASNGPHLAVAAGPRAAIDAFAEALAAENIPCRRLNTTHAFHSRMLEPAGDALRALAENLRPRAPRVPFLSNVSGTWFGDETALGESTADADYWARHMVRPVRFAEALAELWKRPERALVEIGPGNGLTTLALQHPGPAEGTPADAPPRLAVTSLRHAHDKSDDLAHLLTAAAKLWIGGARVDRTAVVAGEASLSPSGPAC